MFPVAQDMNIDESRQQDTAQRIQNAVAKYLYAQNLLKSQFVFPIL